MSAEEVELCVAIIEDHFGKPVASVAHLLLTQPQLRLPSIHKGLKPKLGAKELKRALVILAQHNLLDFGEPATTADAQFDHSTLCHYSLRREAVLQLTLVPWAIYTVKTLYGKVGVDEWIDWPRNGVPFSQLESLLRNELLMELLSLNEVFDAHALKVARLLLELTAKKGPMPGVTLHSLIQRARSEPGGLPEPTSDLINSRLELMECESQGVIKRILDSGGGTYRVDYQAAISQLSLKHIESVIKQSLDGNALRIFRLLCSNAGAGGNYLEEEQIERHAMIPSTETRKACSALLEAGFISVRHICRSIDFAPSRTFYLYGVSEQQLLAHVSQLATLTLRNLIRRRMHEADSHVALTDRHFKMEAITANIQADATLDDEARREQLAEVEREYLSAGDRLQLDKFKRAQQRLSASEIEVARSLFIVQQHLSIVRQETCVPPVKRRARASARGGGCGALTPSTR